MTPSLKNTMIQDVTDLAGIFNQLLGSTLLSTHAMMDCLDNTSLQGDEIKIATVNVSKDKTTVEIVLNGILEGEIIESRKWIFQIEENKETHDLDILVTVQGVTAGKTASDSKTIPYFLAEITLEVFHSIWEL